MSNNAPAPRFFYHASGLALGGRLTAPVSADIVSQAVTSLPSVGGIATATTGAFAQDAIVEISSGGSEVSGSDDGANLPTFSTHARAEVTGLNVLNVLTATAVSAELFSTQQLDAEEIMALPAAGNLPAGSSFIQNLRINNNPINVVPNPTFFGAGTVAQLLAAQKAGAALQVVGATARALAAYTPRGGNASFDDCGFVSSIFQNPFPIPVPGFGNVYLGELLITRYSRQLTMIRIELDVPEPPLEGEIVVASVQGDGGTY